MKQKFLCFFLFFLFLLESGCDGNKAEYTGYENKQGNTNGNIYEEGLFVIEGDWMYYSNEKDYDHLYKRKLDGTQDIMIGGRGFAYEINVVGDWVYYIQGTPGHIWRVTTEGEKLERLENNRCSNLIVVGSNIFYRGGNGEQSSLMKMDARTKAKIILYPDVLEFAIHDGFIYFASTEDRSLYSVDFSGDNLTKLSDDKVGSIHVDDEYVYYAAWNDDFKLYRIRMDGSEKELLCPLSCWNINLYKDYFYFWNQTEKGSLYRMKKDGTEIQLLVKGNIGEINVCDDFLVFRRITEGPGLFRANLDGSDVQPWP